MTTGTSISIKGRGSDLGTHPAHGLSQQTARRTAKLGNFKIFHAKSFDDAIATDGLLQNLIQFSQVYFGCSPRNAGCGGQTWQWARRTNGSRTPQARVIFQSMLSRTTRNARNRKVWRNTSARYSESAGRARSTSLMTADMTFPGRFLLKKPNGQPDDFFVKRISQIGDGSMADKLNDRTAAILGQWI